MQSRRMVRALAVATALLGLASGMVLAADLTGDSRNDSPILPTDDQFNTLSRDEVQQILNQLNVVPPPDVNTKTELRRVIKKVELFRIDPKNGNNPFNVEDPIDNATVNGIVQQVAVDDLNNDDGNNNNGAGLAACIGQTVQGQLSPTAPPQLRFINMLIDPVTLDCSIFGGQSVDGAFLIYQYSPGDLGVQGDENVGAFADAAVPIWRIIDPAAGFVQINGFVAAQTIRIVLQANNGVIIEGTFTLTPIGFTEFSVTVVNLVVQ